MNLQVPGHFAAQVPKAQDPDGCATNEEAIEVGPAAGNAILNLKPETPKPRSP